MWYEILPSAGIIFVAMALPHASAYALNKLVLGNSYRRSMRERSLVLQNLRDRRLGNSPYTVKGLENIPDM